MLVSSQEGSWNRDLSGEGGFEGAFQKTTRLLKTISIPIGCMYGIFTYIYHKNHGSYGIWWTKMIWMTQVSCLCFVSEKLTISSNDHPTTCMTKVWWTWQKSPSHTHLPPCSSLSSWCQWSWNWWDGRCGFQLCFRGLGPSHRQDLWVFGVCEMSIYSWRRKNSKGAFFWIRKKSP